MVPCGWLGGAREDKLRTTCEVEASVLLPQFEKENRLEELCQRPQPGVQNLDSCPEDKWDSRETPTEGPPPSHSPGEKEGRNARNLALDPSLSLLETFPGSVELVLGPCSQSGTFCIGSPSLGEDQCEAWLGQALVFPAFRMITLTLLLSFLAIHLLSFIFHVFVNLPAFAYMCVLHSTQNCSSI